MHEAEQELEPGLLTQYLGHIPAFIRPGHAAVYVCLDDDDSIGVNIDLEALILDCEWDMFENIPQMAESFERMARHLRSLCRGGEPAVASFGDEDGYEDGYWVAAGLGSFPEFVPAYQGKRPIADILPFKKAEGT